MEKILIGLVAPKKSGKDTLGDYLCSSYNFKKYNFADPLKEGIGKIFNLTNDQLYGDKKEEIDPFWGISPRELFQKIGTEIFQYKVPELIPQFKDMDRTFWVKCFEKWYKEKLKEYEERIFYWSSGKFESLIKGYGYLHTKPIFRVVISDVRFQHEAKKIKEMGGILIRLKRSTEENNFSLHSSEIELEKIECDFIIENNDSVNSMFKKFDEVFNKINLS